jgi:hypothetical protein
VYDPKNSGAAERLLMKMITKQTGRVDSISEDKITRFAADLVQSV